jgi:ribonuclease J
VLALLSDSTYSDRPGTTSSEAVLDDAFDQVMRQAPGRVIVATFASLISRIQQVVDVAARHGRRIAITGRTMVENTKMARRLGYLDIPEGMLMNLGEIKGLPARETVIMATGTQGEPTAVLSRLAVGRHSSLRIREGDTVVLSSHTIPGNEELIHRVINRLFQKGADVYYDPLAPVHVSGHASQEEQKLLINMLRPRFFVPIHGELRHLKQHGKTARELGIPAENIAVVENGYVLTVGERLEIGDRVPGGYVFVDGTRVGEIGPAVMRERDALGQNGFVMSIVRYKRRTGQPVGRPRIVTRGFIFVPGAEDLLAQAEEVTLSAASAKPGTPPAEIEKQVQSALSSFLYRETRSRPIVIPAVIEA